MIRILLVEDSQTELLALTQSLQVIFSTQPVPVEFRSATRMDEALSICAEWAPELVMLDLNLRDSSAEQTAPRIAEFKGAPAVVVLTGTDTHALAIQCAAAGCDSFVYKPIARDLERLCSIVLGAMRRRAYPPLYAREGHEPA